MVWRRWMRWFVGCMMGACALAVATVGRVWYVHREPTDIPVQTDDDAASQVVSSPLKTLDDERDRDVLAYAGKTPIVYLDERGYAAGLRHGRLLSGMIHDNIATLDHDLLGIPSTAGTLKKTYLLTIAKQLDAHIPQTYREEMRGIADGADVSYNDILLINTYDDLLYLAGCSSIALPRSQTQPTLIHARNLDYPIDVLAGTTIILHYLPSPSRQKNNTHQQGYITVGFPGCIGALTATNDSGLSLSSHTSTGETPRIGTPSGIVYRQIAESAQTLDDAQQILRDASRTIANNLMVSSVADNDVAIFEITADSLVRRAGNVCTNHFVSDELSGAATPNSKRRYTLLDTLSRRETLTTGDIQTAMATYDGNTRGRSAVANVGTVQSVVIVPAQRVLYLAQGETAPVTDGGYARYDYSTFVTR